MGGIEHTFARHGDVLVVAFAGVVSDRCRSALTSLLLLDGDDEPATWLYDDLDEALRVAESRLAAG